MNDCHGDEPQAELQHIDYCAIDEWRCPYCDHMNTVYTITEMKCPCGAELRILVWRPIQ